MPLSSEVACRSTLSKASAPIYVAGMRGKASSIPSALSLVYAADIAVARDIPSTCTQAYFLSDASMRLHSFKFFQAAADAGVA